MNADELQECISKHPKNQSQIAGELGISSSAMSKWINGSRKIDERGQKLLRLYFYGEIPFGQIADNRWEVLSFTLQEAEAIRHFAQRLGITPEAWIVEQIRTILAIRKAEQALEPSPRAVASKRA